MVLKSFPYHFPVSSWRACADGGRQVDTAVFTMAYGWPLARVKGWLRLRSQLGRQCLAEFLGVFVLMVSWDGERGVRAGAKALRASRVSVSSCRCLASPSHPSFPIRVPALPVLLPNLVPALPISQSPSPPSVVLRGSSYRPPSAPRPPQPVCSAPSAGAWRSRPLSLRPSPSLGPRCRPPCSRLRLLIPPLPTSSSPRGLWPRPSPAERAKATSSPCFWPAPWP